MEYLVFILVLVLFVAVVFVREAYTARCKERKFVQELYADFGKLPNKEYTLERYAHIDSYFRRHKQDGLIDDITWNDLNMDDIFKRVNYAFSASGEEYLYYTLRSAGVSKRELEHLEEVVGYFTEHPDERVKIQYLMAKLGHTGKYSLYEYLENLDILGKRSNKKHIFLDIMFLPLILLAPFKLSLALCGISILICYNILTYFKEKGEIEPYIISFAYLVRLLNACDKMVKIEVPPCREEWQRMQESLERLRNISRHSYFVFSKNRYSTSGNPLDILVDYLRMTFHLDLIQFNTMLERLQNNMEAADTLITLIGYVETAICIGAFRASLKHGYCIPEFSDKDGVKGICLKESYHPLLEEPVKNSIDTANKGILLTGSNASGKSTFLKTVALNVILAQTLHTCMASYYSAPLYRVYSSMSLRDDIQSGESYYMVEIRAIKRILDGTRENTMPVICFVDEVLRGTNTIERIAASTQILRSLYDRGTLCFAATHDIELTELLQDVYENYHFEEEIRDGDVVFPYQLLHGKSTTRNAIRLLEIMGYEEEIIQRAFDMAEQLTKKIS